jgi:thioesterase domain-containing protein/acyl carrier protein
VPSAFVTIPFLPITNNGKLDRKSLPKPGIKDARAQTAYVAPRSNVEFVIAKIWSRILKVDEPGVHDDFAESGGHSLAAVRLINEINRTLNVKLGLSALFQFRTIERLAAFAVENVQPLVVQMATGAEATPLYVVYAGNHQFRVARVLGGQRPVFGIDVPYRTSWCNAAAQNRDDGLPELSELVEPFLDALRAHTRGRPCILAGHCFGGLIAFELARRYSDTGGKVEAVVLLDSFGLVPNAWQLARGRLLRNWATIGRSTLTESWRTLRWVAGQLGRVGWTGMRMRLSDVVTPELTGMRDENGGFVNGTLLNRIYNKVYETVALGRVPTVGILVRAKITSDAEKPYRELDPNLGWSEAFAGGLHVIETSGDHMSMIEADDNLDALGRHVNKKLDLVSPGTTGSDSDRTLKAAS